MIILTSKFEWEFLIGAQTIGWFRTLRCYISKTVTDTAYDCCSQSLIGSHAWAFNWNKSQVTLIDLERTKHIYISGNQKVICWGTTFGSC